MYGSLRHSLGKNLLLTMWGFLTTLMILFVPYTYITADKD